MQQVLNKDFGGYIYIRHEWGSVGYFWESGYLGLWCCDGVNVKFKALVSKGLFVAD